MRKSNSLETQSLKILPNKKQTQFTKNLKNFFETFTIKNHFTKFDRKFKYFYLL